MCVIVPNRMPASTYQAVCVSGGWENKGVLKRYRFWAYLTVGQEKSCARLFGCVRVVSNDVIVARERAFSNGEPFVSSAVSPHRSPNLWSRLCPIGTVGPADEVLL